MPKGPLKWHLIESQKGNDSPLAVTQITVDLHSGQAIGLGDSLTTLFQSLSYVNPTTPMVGCPRIMWERGFVMQTSHMPTGQFSFFFLLHCL